MTYSECLNLNHAVKLAFNCLNSFQSVMYAEFYMAYIKIVRLICIKCTYLIWECDDELSLQRDKSFAACTPSLWIWFWLFFWGINTSSVNTAFRCSSVSDAVIETLVLKCCCRSWLHIHRNLLLPCAEYTWVKCALLLTNSLCLSPCL